LPDYRKRRIVERLAELPQATVEDMQALQYDVLSTQARELLPALLAPLPDSPLRRRLAAWDMRYNPASLEATLFARFYRNVVLEIFGHEQGIGWRRMLYLCTRVGFSTMVLTAIDHLLVKDDSLWWSGRDKGELIRRAAERTLREKDQAWSETNAFTFTNRYLESRLVGRTFGFHTGEIPMPGNHATVFQGHLLRAARRETTFAPSYHFVTDLGTHEAWTNLPGGPSESRASRLYRNDLRRWRRGEYKRVAGD
jgi:penicillin amidase